jgi:zinc transporter 2
MIVVVICFLFMIVEVAGGIVSGSLAILTDAAHMLSDVAAFLISMFSIWLGLKKHNMTSTFGYHRAEVLGALSSVVLIWAMLVWLLLEAIDRLIDHGSYEIDAKIMIITSCISLVCNIFSLIALGHCPCAKVDASFMDNL